MTVYTFDRTLNGLLSAVFDAFSFHEMPEAILGAGDTLPLFYDRLHEVVTDEEKARRVWTGLEKKLSRQGLHVISVSYLSELNELDIHLFNYICKIFHHTGKLSLERNFSDEDVLFCTNTCRRVHHEALRMKQFLRFQKAMDGTYLGVIHPDQNVLPLIVDHFRDRFNDQCFLIFDAKRKYGYYYDQHEFTHITFAEGQSLPFNQETGQMNEELLAENDKIFQELWRTYFKAICIRERLNPKKQAGDMPRRYWKYMTEKQ